MRTINFSEREVLAYYKADDEPVKYLVSSVNLLNIIDNGKVLISRITVNDILRILYLCTVENYKPLNQWTEQEIDNKIIELL